MFFFTSRRRHTRLVSDWSSDVCSSDLSSFPAESPFGVCARFDDCARRPGKLLRGWLQLSPDEAVPAGDPAIEEGARAAAGLLRRASRAGLLLPCGGRYR